MKNIKKIDGQSVYYNILVKILLNGVLLRLNGKITHGDRFRIRLLQKVLKDAM